MGKFWTEKKCSYFGVVHLEVFTFGAFVTVYCICISESLLQLI